MSGLEFVTRTALSAGSSGLTPTAVKTANYTAVAGDLVLVDTTSGPVTVTLPAAAAGTPVGVKLVTLGAGNAVTIAAAGSDVFNKAGGSTTLSLTLLNQSVVLAGKPGVWAAQSDDLPLSQLDARYGAAVTRRVTTPLHVGGGGAAAGAGAFRDLLMRMLVTLPVTTTRWRIRARNYDVKNNVAGAGTFTCTGVYFGDPSFGANRWSGAFVTAPTSALGSFALATAAASDTSSPWVTDPTLQFNARQMKALSLGFTGDASSVMLYATLAEGILYQAAGAAATAANAAAPASDESYMAFDLRLEYEYLAEPDQPVVLCIGDSITAGMAGNDSGAYPHESWPGQAGLRSGIPFLNTGINGTGSADWVASIGTTQRWTRLDLTTTVPDVAIIDLGRNELGSLSTFQNTNFPALVAYLKGTLGVKEIWLATLIPSNLSGTNETNRQAWNTWIRTVPSGVHGIIDFDRAIVDFANPAIAFSAFMPIGAEPHPNRPGYQQMATVVPAFAWRQP